MAKRGQKPKNNESNTSSKKIEKTRKKPGRKPKKNQPADDQSLFHNLREEEVKPRKGRGRPKKQHMTNILMSNLSSQEPNALNGLYNDSEPGVFFNQMRRELEDIKKSFNTFTLENDRRFTELKKSVDNIARANNPAKFEKSLEENTARVKNFLGSLFAGQLKKIKGIVENKKPRKRGRPAKNAKVEISESDEEEKKPIFQNLTSNAEIENEEKPRKIESEEKPRNMIMTFGNLSAVEDIKDNHRDEMIVEDNKEEEKKSVVEEKSEDDKEENDEEVEEKKEEEKEDIEDENKGMVVEENEKEEEHDGEEENKDKEESNKEDEEDKIEVIRGAGMEEDESREISKKENEDDQTYEIGDDLKDVFSLN